MKKKVIIGLIGLLIASGAVFVGVRYWTTQHTPQATVTTFLKDVTAKNYAGAQKTGSAVFRRDNSAQTVSDRLDYLDFANATYQVGNSSTTTNDGTVILAYLTNNNTKKTDTIAFKLVKESGNWKVDAIKVD